MSYTLLAFKRVLNGFEGSCALRLLDRLSASLEKAFERSKLYRVFAWLGVKLKESFIGQWFLKPEEEVDVFSTSRAMKKGVDIADAEVRKAEKAYKRSFAGGLISGLFREVQDRPVFAVSVVVVSAVAANTLLWLVLGEIDVFGLLVRLVVMVIGFLGLGGMKLLRKALRGSRILKGS